MKRALLASFVILSLLAIMHGGVSAAESIASGSLIKTADNSTIYYVGEDNKLYVFPNDKTYFSWFDGFDDIKTVSQELFASYQLGGNVYYKPGSLLVKTPTSFKVYAVGLNGELRWIESEEMAKEFYGDNWAKLVDDIPEGFFTNYRFGKSIAKSEDYDPEQEEEQAPTIGHARGLKAKVKLAERRMERQERRCQFIKNSVNRLQERAERWGIEVPGLGDDYMAKCLSASTSPDKKDDDKKVTVCKAPKGNEANAHTITISKNALKKHLREGYTLGACEDDGGWISDDTKAPVVSEVKATPSISSAVITWKTNEESESKVEFDDTNPMIESRSVSDREDVKEHSLTLTGLSASTTYYFIVRSTDAAGNVGSSSIMSFTTGTADTVAPTITEIDVTASDNNAYVSWTTDEAADSKVYYSTESFSASGTILTLFEDDMVTSHDLNLTGLASSTKYYFKIESKDQWGNKTLSSENNFTTDAE